jgi:hypothetical protein
VHINVIQSEDTAMTRHIGAFILNTVIPVIDRLERLLDKHPDALNKIDALIAMEINKISIYCLTTVVISAIIAFTIMVVCK